MGLDAMPFLKVEEVNTNVPTSLARTVKKYWQDKEALVNMNSIQYGRGKPYAGHPRSMGIRQNHYRQTNAGFPSQKFSGGRDEKNHSNTSETKSWLASKRDVPSSPVPLVQRREIPPLKKANVGQTSEPHEETKQEEFTLVKGVPDWFLKQVKPDLFQGYKNSTRSGNKTFKPPSSNSGNWVLIRDPKSKIPQMVLLLSRTQKRMLQRKYTLFQSGESSTGEESERGARPNPRFNRAQKDPEEDFRIQFFREEETLKKIASAMLEEDFDPPSPNSLASYQSGLLKAMLVE
ncbi:hypothetical protein RHGRI_023651 [Rhododendron griersonianum]|uniref:Uncharacterized protein n=1 Tax=Rhododendron griersonianum TaxID=479676 RepID=A0AAV6JBJ4_9ERIC|nr:hypothetical protein RHGRI_023651 [Rhododendron griersonianum]